MIVHCIMTSINNINFNNFLFCVECIECILHFNLAALLKYQKINNTQDTKRMSLLSLRQIPEKTLTKSTQA